MNENLNLHNPTIRVLEILKIVASSDNGVSFSEISAKSGISKGTLHPILTTLVSEGFLESEKGKISIGKWSFKVGNAYSQRLNFVHAIKPYMNEIVCACDEICQLGILDGGHVLYVEKREPKQAIKLESYVGKSLLAYATALGKCLLSVLSDDEIRSLYVGKFETYTSRTVSNIEALLAQIHKVRANGYAYETGESNIDVECVAVPIIINGEVVASLSVSLPSFRSNEEKIGKIVAILKHYAKVIEQSSK